VIRLENVSCRYGSRAALNGVSLAVADGETLSLVGPNSAGKSTLLKAMGGLLRVSDGHVWLEDRLMQDWKPFERARRLAWVPSEADFTFSYTVFEITMLGRTPHLPSFAPPAAADAAVVHRMLALTDLSALADRPIDTLSSGERQRVLLARALAQEPSILLMDEPTAHLDIGHAQTFFRALDRLRGERALTVVLATHDLPLARRFSARVALLREGRLHGIGSPDQLLTPQNIQTVFELQEEAYI